MKEQIGEKEWVRGEKTKYFFFTGFFLYLIVLSCGRQNPSTKQQVGPTHTATETPTSSPSPTGVPSETITPTPTDSPQPKRKIRVLLWGFDTCDGCKKQLPEIHQGWKALTAKEQEYIQMQLYVPCTGGCLVKADQAVAEQYRNQLGLTGFSAFADPWYWKTFKKFLGNRVAAPAGVILDDQEKIIKAFPPGATSFVPNEIISYAVKAIYE